MYLGYNENNKRYGVLCSDLWEIDGLHCGDRIKIYKDNKWINTRIEYNARSSHSHGWYIVDMPMQKLEHLSVRLE